MVLWGQMGDRVLGVNQSGDPRQGLSSHATARADGSVQVLAINKGAADDILAVAFTGFDPTGRAVDVYTLSPGGPDRTSRDAVYNGARNPAPGALPAPRTKTASLIVAPRLRPLHSKDVAAGRTA